MGAHGWVVEIRQPWERYSIWGLAEHSGRPWISLARTYHLSEAAVNLFIISSYRKIQAVKLDVFSSQNLILHFDLC